MRVCMYLCMHVCMHLCMHVCTYLCMYVCMVGRMTCARDLCMLTCTYVSHGVCMYTSHDVCMFPCTPICMCAYTLMFRRCAQFVCMIGLVYAMYGCVSVSVSLTAFSDLVYGGMYACRLCALLALYDRPCIWNVWVHYQALYMAACMHVDYVHARPCMIGLVYAKYAYVGC